MADAKLKEYRARRKRGRTPEPWGGRRGKKRERGPVFVIQKHQATSLHYDVRLEASGVLKSWAVPKGPSTDPRVKRLAVPTEDHPLGYADFEGVIPKGEYGAGTVLVWDRGSFRSLKKDGGKTVSVANSIPGGHVLVWLEGRKLRGGFSLIRTGKGQKARWLLVKMRDEEADARRNPVSTEPKSVLTGRTIKQVRDAEANGNGGK